MSLKEEIISLLKKHNLKPIKYRGQNFLISEEYLNKIVALCNLKNDETVIEVGPGIGNLTKKLLEKGVRVIAVEKDENLAKILDDEISNKNLKVVISDILKFDEKIIKTPYKVVGNIPYYITGPIIKKFLFSSNPPVLIILTIQKEVAERMVLEPPKATYLSIILGMLAEVNPMETIKAKYFWPIPKVNSQIVVIKPNKKVDRKDEKLIRFIKTGFRQPRKTLLNNLAAIDQKDKQKIRQSFKDVGLTGKTRAHELILKKWKELYLKFTDPED